MTIPVDALLRSALLEEAEQAMSLTDTPAAHERLRERIERDNHRRPATLTIVAAAASVGGAAAPWVGAVVAAVTLTGGDRSARQQPVEPGGQSPAPTVITVDTSPPLPSSALIRRGAVEAPRVQGTKWQTQPVRANLTAAAGSLWSVSASGK